ncbi:flagellar biosynthetic protein FliQ [Thermomonas sp.]|uniref:flagellar biosynthetic protein FliQ n=1 Tax=Thermomonas sp. TaxID=1971895 RepID=UPI0035AE31FE
MTPEVALSQISQGLYLAMLLGAPLLLAVLATGVVVGILQAATSINEPTVAFVCKVGALVAALSLTGNYLLGRLVSFTTELFHQIPHLIG